MDFPPGEFAIPRKVTKKRVDISWVADVLLA
jgi:hypothetical protein